MKICYSDNKDEFKKALFGKIEFGSFDFPFFAGDILDALENRTQIDIIDDNQESTINGKVVDAEISFPIDLKDTLVLELQLKNGLRTRNFKFNVVMKKILQNAPKKYYVNDESCNQILTMYIR